MKTIYKKLKLMGLLDHLNYIFDCIFFLVIWKQKKKKKTIQGWIKYI